MSITRRQLMRMVAVFAPLAPKIAFQGDDFELAQLKTYKGYAVRWRGFFHSHDSDVCVGQWIAYGPHRDGVHVYSSYPGDTGYFWNGCIFNVGLRPEQEIPNTRSTPEQLRSYQADALARLMHYIDTDPDGRLRSGKRAAPASLLLQPARRRCRAVPRDV